MKHDLVTESLRRLRSGDADAWDELTSLVYEELRRRAGRLLRYESPNHLLQPTELVHEAYLHLVDQRRVQYKDRLHFFRVAAHTMRRVLVDHARASRHQGSKGWEQLPIDDVAGKEPLIVDVLEVHELLNRLAREDPRAAEVLVIMQLGGLTARETAALLGVSERTAKRDWQFGRAWLTRELSRR